jgi:3-isopropylmalate dehydratase small subunit
MAHELTGRVWLLPDNIETGQILPSGALAQMDEDVPSAALFSEVAPGLAGRISAGDILWAGEGFGQGSSREGAPRLIQRAGIRLVLASSFARIFYRNAINIGLSVAVGHPGDTRDGDEIQVNLVTGEVTNLTRDLKLKVEPVPKAIRPILAEGGLIAYIQKYGRLSQTDGH